MVSETETSRDERERNWGGREKLGGEREKLREEKHTWPTSTYHSLSSLKASFSVAAAPVDKVSFFFPLIFMPLEFVPFISFLAKEHHKFLP